MLENLLHHVNDAVRSSLHVDDIDEALCAGDFLALMELTKVDDFDTLFSNDVESSYEQPRIAASVYSCTANSSARERN